MVVPWARFPANLEPLVSCTIGVEKYITKERFRNEIAEMEAEMEADHQEALNEQENNRVEEREREKADEESPGDELPSYDDYSGPDEAQEWHDYDPDA